MVDNYRDVEISAEEMASLSTETESKEPSPEATQEEVKTEESVNTESQEVESVEDDTDDSEMVFEFEGNEYSAEDIYGWMQDSKNKEDWQKSNTQKAQELSKWNKFSQKFEKDPALQEYIKDYFFENPEEWNNLQLQKALEQETEEPQEEPQNNQLNDIDERLSNLEVDKNVQVLESQLDNIIKNNSDMFKDGNSMEFLEFVDDNEILDLDVGFKLWSHDKLTERLSHYKKMEENKERSQSKIIDKSEIGAKQNTTPFKPKDYRDITLDNPDIAKYFQ
mgnify:CR=1 FL=1